METELTKAGELLEPPTLQVMVSDSELWLINERNTRQKHEGSVTTVSNGGNAGPEALSLTLGSSDPNGASPEQEVPKSQAEASAMPDCFGSPAVVVTKRRDIVLTDIKAHNYSVVFKECYNSDHFINSGVD